MSHTDFKGDKDPWGRPRKKSPPDLEELIKNFFAQLGFGRGHSSGHQGNGGGSFLEKWGFIPALLAIVLAWMLLGIYVVSPPEEAVVTLFGKYYKTTEPGLHWIAPVIMSKTKINVQAVKTFPYKAAMLTKDENIVNVSLAIQYQILNPKDYLYQISGPETTLRQATGSALRQVVGHTDLDDILTSGRQVVSQQVTDSLKAIIKDYRTGLLVRDVTMQPATPPEEVTGAFNDAIKAREDKQRYINKANAYQRRVLAQVEGQTARLLQSASAYKQTIILAANANVKRFNAFLQPYLRAPEVTKKRMYLDMMSDVLSKTTNIVADPLGRQMLYLPLDRKAHVVSAAASTIDSGNASGGDK